MMISPEGYYEFNLKGKSADEIRSAIRGLKQGMGRKKNNLENPTPRCVEHCICPSKETQIDCERMYLQRAIQALEELGEKYIPSKREQKAIEFDSKIEKIKEIIFHIGSWCDVGKNTIVRIEGENVKFFKSELENEVGIEVFDPMTKEEFCELFRDLYIGEWQSNYSCFKFGVYMLDGTEWELRIRYDDDTKERVISGANCYPYNFSKLLDLLGINDDEEADED